MKKDSSISRPDIQKFIGALRDNHANKGVFITTAKFSTGAMESAKNNGVILMDGQELAKLMVEYGLGVSVSKTYNIKKIDTDFFEDEE